AWMTAVLVIPFAAGTAAGLVMVRVAPSPSYEVAPLWGFACGLSTGAAAGALAALSGGPLGDGRLATVGPSPWEVVLSVTLEVGVAAGMAAGVSNWWLIFRASRGHASALARLGTAAAPVRKAGAALARVAGKVGLAEPVEPSKLPGHWLDATEAETQPIPVVRDDWMTDPASAAAETALPGRGRSAADRPPRRDIVHETDDRGGHAIYVDPYAWDRD